MSPQSKNARNTTRRAGNDNASLHATRCRKLIRHPNHRSQKSLSDMFSRPVTHIPHGNRAIRVTSPNDLFISVCHPASYSHELTDASLMSGTEIHCTLFFTFLLPNNYSNVALLFRLETSLSLYLALTVTSSTSYFLCSVVVSVFIDIFWFMSAFLRHCFYIRGYFFFYFVLCLFSSWEK